MTLNTTRRTVLAGTGAAALLSATGVSMADEHEDEEDDQELPETASVSAVHASPDAPNVDVYINGLALLRDVAFRDISDYLVLLEGEYNVQIVPAEEDDENGVEDGNGVGDDETGAEDDENGAGEDDENGMTDDENGVEDDEVDPTEDAVIDEDIEVPAGVATAAVVGEVDEEGDQELELLLMEIDLDDLDDEESRVRAVHASPDAPAVDIAADGDVILEDLAFGEFESVDVEEGEYTLEVRPAGEEEAVGEFPVDLQAGVVYSAYAVGFLEPDEENGVGDEEENGIGDDDENGVGDDEENGADDDENGMTDDENDVGNDVDDEFFLQLNVDALTPESDVDDEPTDEDDEDPTDDEEPTDDDEPTDDGDDAGVDTDDDTETDDDPADDTDDAAGNGN